MELPEKQGLKRCTIKVSGKPQLVAVELPEKQGLKHKFKVITSFFILSCSGTSRKTRIETSEVVEEATQEEGCSGTSRKTRIETRYANI